PWYTDIPMADDLALLISALNHDASLSRLMAPAARIDQLLEEQKKKILPQSSLTDKQLSFADINPQNSLEE
ncbi:MAG: hypothetical protein RBS18_05580, partial [Clostridia bacterium]|nr:hypothetical protein [Clostridia bacterium]